MGIGSDAGKNAVKLFFKEYPNLLNDIEDCIYRMGESYELF